MGEHSYRMVVRHDDHVQCLGHDEDSDGMVVGQDDNVYRQGFIWDSDKMEVSQDEHVRNLRHVEDSDGMVVSHDEHSLGVEADALWHVLLVCDALDVLPAGVEVVDLARVDVAHVPGDIDLVVGVHCHPGWLHLFALEDGVKREGFVALGAPGVDGDHLALVGVADEDEVLGRDADELGLHEDLNNALDLAIDGAVDADELASEVT